MEMEIKGVQIGKDDVKLSLFADGTILYIENLKKFTKELLEVISKFRKAEGHKINRQKSTVFLYIGIEQSKNK